MILPNHKTGYSNLVQPNVFYVQLEYDCGRSILLLRRHFLIIALQ